MFGYRCGCHFKYTMHLKNTKLLCVLLKLVAFNLMLEPPVSLEHLHDTSSPRYMALGSSIDLAGVGSYHFEHLYIEVGLNA
jgi:hypothetical protein